MSNVHAEGDEGSNGGRGDVGRKEVRVLLEGGDGSGGSKAHYSCRRRFRGLVYRGRRGVVGEGGEQVIPVGV